MNKQLTALQAVADNPKLMHLLMTTKPLDNMLKYKEFVREAAFYRDANTGSRDELVYVLAGVAGEGGEALDVVKKLIRVPDSNYNQDLVKRMPDLIQEVGDVLWYIQAFCNVIGISVEHLAALNKDKLEQRYPTNTATNEHWVIRRVTPVGKVSIEMEDRNIEPLLDFKPIKPDESLHRTEWPRYEICRASAGNKALYDIIYMWVWGTNPDDTGAWDECIM